MSHYSDPTAARALGGINREFNRLEKKAKKLCRLLDEGKITTEYFEAAQAQFTGIYRHVLMLTNGRGTRKSSAKPPHKPAPQRHLLRRRNLWAIVELPQRNEMRTKYPCRSSSVGN